MKETLDTIQLTWIVIGILNLCFLIWFVVRVNGIFHHLRIVSEESQRQSRLIAKLAGVNYSSTPEPGPAQQRCPACQAWNPITAQFCGTCRKVKA